MKGSNHSLDRVWLDPWFRIAPAVHDRRGVVFNVVGVVRHDGIQITAVPRIDPRMRDPSGLLYVHDVKAEGLDQV